MNKASMNAIIIVFFLTVLGSAGCAKSPETKTDSLDLRLAWPCERLVTTWAIDGKALQTRIGDDLVVRAHKGLGELQLSVMRCAPSATAQRAATPLLFSTITVPVTADSAPIVITNIPTDGWSSLLHLVADENGEPPFSQMGYEVLPADMYFNSRETLVEIQLTFDGGQIAIVVNITGASTDHDAERALLSHGADTVSAFFGQEKGRRTLSVSATVQLQGKTPLSGLNLPETPTTAVFDFDVVSDRIFWRLPTAQQ